MAGRQLYRSHSNQDLHRRASALLAQRPRESEFLALAATRSAADDFARANAGEGLLGVHTLTLTQLAAAVAAPELARRGLTPMSLLGLEALAARVVYTLHRGGKLEYFGPVADTPGFVRAFTATAGELRMEEIGLEDVEKTGPPGRDLARLLAEFATQMEKGGLSDRAALFHAAIEAAGAGHRLLGLPLLLLDAPLRTSLEARFAQAVVERSPAASAVALAADEGTIAALERCLGVKAQEGGADDETMLGRVRNFVFAAKLPLREAIDTSLDFFSAAGEGLESVEIARRIRRLADEGVAFDRIAILLRAPERYQPLVEEALRRAGIPAYFRRGCARPDPAGRALLALLQCAAEGCSASRFAEYLSLAQVPDLDERGAPVRVERTWIAPRDEVLASFTGDGAAAAETSDETAPALSTPIGWEQLLVDAAVVGGRARWARRLRGLEAELRLQRTKLETDDDSHRQSLERRIGQLRVLENYALPLIDLLAALPRQALWSEWIERLSEAAETALRRPEPVLAALNELLPMGEVGPAGLDEVFAVLEERLRFLRRDPPERRYGCVFVGGIEEARGRSFEAVFLPGLAEGLFPRRAMEDPLLLDVYRGKLGGRLVQQDDRVADERLRLRLAAAAGARLIVSYPRMDVAQARPRVPSFYALEVLRAAEGRLPDLREFEKRAAQASRTRLGWPAPPNPADALDDAEYDLATLDRARQLPRGRARGAARYLVEANEALARSLRARWSRWHGKWSAADGLVDPPQAVRELLAGQRLRRRSYSTTALQNYSACPYKFLLHGIHQLRPREEAAPLEQMDPLTRGALMHDVQHKLFVALEDARLLPVRKAELARVFDVADETLNRVAAQHEEDLAPAIPRVWASEVEDLRTDLRGWLRHIADGEWTPIHFEHEFEAVDLDRVCLRGRVDLIERHRARAALRITDHKSGRVPDRLPGYVGGGATLQPLLYGMAIEKLLGEPVESGRLFYCTQRGNYRELEIRLTDAARQRAGLVLEAIDQAVESGFLPAAPQHEACDVCDYRPVCGPHEEERVRHKRQDRIEPLYALRNIP